MATIIIIIGYIQPKIIMFCDTLGSVYIHVYVILFFFSSVWKSKTHTAKIPTEASRFYLQAISHNHDRSNRNFFRLFRLFCYFMLVIDVVTDIVISIQINVWIYFILFSLVTIFAFNFAFRNRLFCKKQYKSVWMLSKWNKEGCQIVKPHF